MLAASRPATTRRRDFFSSLRTLVELFAIATLVSACGAATLATQSSREVEVPPYASAYSTDAGRSGVRGSEAATRAEHQLKEKLRQRGDGEAKPDAALAATAAWALKRAYANQNLSDTRVLADAAMRFGFTGLVQGFAIMPLSDARAEELIGSMLAGVPGNSRVTRYGIVGGAGSDVAFLIGAVEASLEDFPRAVAPGGSLRLSGELDPRFERASVFSTNPSGETREIAMPSRKVEATLEFPLVGTYSLELMGYGSTGPVVLMNVPIRVGVEEAAESEGDVQVDPNLTPEKAQDELLSLLNTERVKHGLARVELDGELGAIALAHSEDMALHDFFGHVSPNTGAPEDRVRKADVRVSRVGECVALELTPERAHRGLLASPAHRAAMLDPRFTHVGIGVAFRGDEPPPRRLRVTLLLGRRVPPEETRQSAESVAAYVQSLRQSRKLGSVRVDPILTAVASAGTTALANASDKSSRTALAASASELQRQVNRTKRSRSVCQSFVEVLEREELGSVGLLSDPDLASIGVGVVELTDAKGSRLGVLVAGEARPGSALRCR
ncbi:MAG TPA: CAP domain-containing protein [Polyangiaceae bacterium]|nr:CAP domain-containing protein [Polyangiaceae bacterium]